MSVLGTAMLNLAELASTAEKEIEITVSLVLPGVTTESHPTLHVSLFDLSGLEFWLLSI